MAASTLRKPMHHGDSGTSSKVASGTARESREASPWLVAVAPADADTQSEARKPALGLAIALTFSACFWVALAIAFL
jgi:hypothetical protein